MAGAHGSGPLASTSRGGGPTSVPSGSISSGPRPGSRCLTGICGAPILSPVPKSLPPAIIDLSPYWRPTAFASAVVAVDALVWAGADSRVLGVLAGHPDASQHLLRAAIFRVVMDHLCNPE